jgi:hypothetical protein
VTPAEAAVAEAVAEAVGVVEAPAPAGVTPAEAAVAEAVAEAVGAVVAREAGREAAAAAGARSAAEEAAPGASCRSRRQIRQDRARLRPESPSRRRCPSCHARPTRRRDSSQGRR